MSTCVKAANAADRALRNMSDTKHGLCNASSALTLCRCLIFSWLGKRWYACKEKALNDFILPVTSGMIAGEGIAGIAQAMFGVAHVAQGTIGCVGGFPC